MIEDQLATVIRSGELHDAAVILMSIAVTEHERVTVNAQNYKFATGVIAGALRHELFPLDLPPTRLEELLSMVAVLNAPMFAEAALEKPIDNPKENNEGH